MFDVRRLAVVALLLLTAAACSSSSKTAATAPTSAPGTTTATTPYATAPAHTVTTDAPAKNDCVASAAAAAVKTSPVAGLNSNPTQYKVTGVRIAASDPGWGRFNAVAAPGVTDYQGGYGVLHCIGTHWTVFDFGTDHVGCPNGTTAGPAAVTRNQLG